MIEFVTGLPGSGKSLYATKRIIEARKAGRRVVANFHSRRDLWDFALWETMKLSHNALVVVDEAQMWFNSRAWKNQTVADLGVFQMSRKNGLDLLMICQHENRVDVAVKELAAYNIRCKRVYSKYIVAKRYVWEEPKPVSREVFRIRPSLYGQYYTSEVIGERDGTGYRFGAIGAYSEIVDGQILPTHYRVSDAYTTVVVPATELSDALARSYARLGPHDRLPSFFPLLQDETGFYPLAPARSYTRADALEDSVLGDLAKQLRARLPSHLL